MQAVQAAEGTDQADSWSSIFSDCNTIPVIVMLQATTMMVRTPPMVKLEEKASIKWSMTFLQAQILPILTRN